MLPLRLCQIHQIRLDDHSPVRCLCLLRDPLDVLLGLLPVECPARGLPYLDELERQREDGRKTSKAAIMSDGHTMANILAFFSISVVSRKATGRTVALLTITAPSSASWTSSIGVSLKLSSSQAASIFSLLYLNGCGLCSPLLFVSVWGK